MAKPTEPFGVVEWRGEKLVLSVQVVVARAKFASLIKLLNSGQIDSVEVKSHKTVVCRMTAPAERANKRLPVGEIKLD